MNRKQWAVIITKGSEKESELYYVPELILYKFSLFFNGRNYQVIVPSVGANITHICYLSKKTAQKTTKQFFFSP